MKTLASFCALLALAGFAPSGPAPTTPTWKLAEGDVFYVRHTRKSEQKLHVENSIIRHESKSTIVSQITVLKPAIGVLTMQQKILSATAGNEGDKDATKDMLQALNGVTLTFHVEKNSVKMEGYDALVKKLTKGDAGLEKTVHAFFPEADFRATVEQLFDCLPAQPVEKGATWDSEATERLGLLGLLKVTTKWTFAGDTGEAGMVKVTGTQKILPNTSTADKSLPFAVKAGIVKETDVQLQITFDTVKHRLHKRTLTRHLHLQYLIEKDKRALDMHIDQNDSATLEVLDKNPIKAEK